jgi:Fic family protein
MNTRAGALRDNLSGDAAYRSFVPARLPPCPALQLDDEALALLVEAHRNIALLDGLADRIPSVKLLVSMYVRKEALMSSQIEGTQATLEDILDPGAPENANADVSEVINYVKAMYYALDRMNELPICCRLIREIHAVLMQGVRGQDKDPGYFRHSQNWLGGQGSTIKSARYIPPNVEDMAEAMDALETYINGEERLDPLVRAALIHYQFETIHPFLDGNGRVGRLLVVIFLIRQTVLHTPALYLSYFLKKNRSEYYDRLSAVRRNGDYEQWVKFFLRAAAESAKDAVATSDTLIRLHDKNTALIDGLGRGAVTARRVFSYVEESPIIEVRKTAEALRVTFKTASLAVEKLCRLGILAQNGDGSRNRNFAYSEYLAVLDAGTENME